MQGASFISVAKKMKPFHLWYNRNRKKAYDFSCWIELTKKSTARHTSKTIISL